MKRYGTLDVVSGGRLVLGLGLGVGSLAEEFALLGRTARSLRRAVELDCDGWVPFALEPEAVQALLARARDSAAWARRTRPLDVGLAPEPPLDPMAEPARVHDQVARHAARGATLLDLRFRSRSLAHHLEQLDAFARLVPLDAPDGARRS